MSSIIYAYICSQIYIYIPIYIHTDTYICALVMAYQQFTALFTIKTQLNTMLEKIHNEMLSYHHSNF